MLRDLLWVACNYTINEQVNKNQFKKILNKETEKEEEAITKEYKWEK